MKLNLKVFDRHTDIKSWRGALASSISISLFLLLIIFVGLARDTNILLVFIESIVCGMYLRFVIFQLNNKPEASPEPVREHKYWVFTKDPTRTGVFGPYTKGEAILFSREFNDSYPLDAPQATYIKADSQVEARIAAKKLRKP